MRLDAIAARLGDVAGVVGSFVSNAEGEFVFAAMPAEFGEPELRRTTSRLASIIRCATLSGLVVERCDLKVGSRRLLVSQFRGGTLCVLAEPGASRRSVRMAMRLATIELSTWVDSMAPDLSPDVANCDEDDLTTRYCRSEQGSAPT